MIILNDSSKQIEILLGAAPTAQLQWTCSYVDIIQNGFGNSIVSSIAGDQTQGLTNGITTVPIVAGPTSSDTGTEDAERHIKKFSCYNPNTSVSLVTIQYNDGTFQKPEFKVYLQGGYNLCYEDGRGWYVLDQFGSPAVSPSTNFSDMDYIQLAGTDNYTGIIPGLVSYVQLLNKDFGVIVPNPNTGPVTFDFGFGAKPVTKFGFDPMVANDFRNIQQMYKCSWDGTQFQITSPTDNIQVNE